MNYFTSTLSNSPFNKMNPYRKTRYSKSDFINATNQKPRELSTVEKIAYELLYVVVFIGITYFIYWFYKNDPGGAIEKTPNLLLAAFLVATAAALYMTTKDPSTNVNNNWFQTAKYIILFGCFAVICSVLAPKITTSASTWVQNTQMIVYIFIIVTFLFLLMNLVMFAFAIRSPDVMTADVMKSYRTFIFKTLGYFSLTSMVILCIILLFSFFASFASQTSSSSVGRWIILILIILIVAFLLFQLLSMTSFYKKSMLIQLIMDSLFYIPCIFINGINGLIENFTQTKPSELVWLLVAIMLVLFYVFLNKFKTARYTKGGKQLVNMPVELNQAHTLGTFSQISGLTAGTPLYTYALSFWFFIDAYPPNYNSEKNRYLSMINNGEMPNVLYKPSENALYFTMKRSVQEANTDTTEAPAKTKTTKKTNIDIRGNTIVYKLKNIQFQKWNNVVINYSGGTLDIFYNNVLKQSVPGIVSYMNYDSLQIGEESGIYGSICNVVYFHEALDINKINSTYEAVYKKTPPVLKKDDNTLLDAM
jgi:hypothetical protein